MSAPNDNAGGHYVQKVRDDTNRAMSEIKGQNERLRIMVAALEADRSRLQLEKIRLQEQLMNVREDLAQRVDEHNTLMRRLSEVQRENESVAGRFVEIETQNTNLANLYVAGYQLHGSLDIAAHSHAELIQSVALRDLVEQREMRRGLLIGRRDAHQAGR